LADKKEKKFEGVKIVTPIVKTGYNHLNKPDEYKGVKNFKTELIFTAEELDEIKGKVEKVIDTQFDEVIAGIKNPKNKKKVYKAYPWTEQEDDDGEETGNFIIRLKSKPNDKGKRRFPIVDANGDKTDVLVYGGSKIRAEVYVKPYVMDVEGPEGKFKKVGVTLYIQAIQIAELAGDGGSGEGRHSFGKIDGGYVGGGDDDDDDGEGTSGGSSTEDEDDDF
jgi:hypothetical protein